ncbi:MAG: peptidase M23, partial [Alphaproteobacteria bacterium]
LERFPPEARLIHPGGSLAAARSGLLMAEIVPTLRKELAILRGALQRISALRAAQSRARDTLRRNLAGLQEARAALTRQLAGRDRPAGPPVDADKLRADAATLHDLAAALGRIAPPATPEDGFESMRGRLALPVNGTILHRFGEADAAGITRPGLVIEAAPQALVTSPVRATLLYAGPFLDYGEIVILEPAPEYLVVLAGLGHIVREAGEIIEPGEPLGTLGGLQPAGEEFLIEQTGALPETRSETLYLELRRDGAPIDPMPWFAAKP